ncbi:SslE/AcfD family lipoprotein zinc metalloprotease [Aliivibrio sp. S3MY1]|uniref:SslE/AcfD family lipoprotein zinc metalloprotease n=1 Tax=unclassified Aliivibrio TaxID=2645654 RepID=UPI0023793ED8|nr:MULTISPECIES: SslE/AcfD family lipoprotein zinc metalloprotease [unclassified Aliivibrio]MDD9196078.1 SslE/AcfD family lipoprotein zinc metalloprotease [Aliivibrio sp. S3MY1]MDD9199255.1 SslE/AcfD family lipoprotein zinc metalloprotease [Aliivibrio sp. S2MY1]
MSKKLLLASLISMLLAGCNQEDISINGTTPDIGGDGGITPPTTTPEPEPESIPYRFTLTSGSKPIVGATCDGIKSDNAGLVALEYKDDSLPLNIACFIGNTPLSTFDLSATRSNIISLPLELSGDTSSLKKENNNDALANIQSLLSTVDADGVDSNGYQFIDGEESTINFAKHQTEALTKNENDFLMQNISYLKDDKPVGVEPGHGTDVEPEITPGSDDVTGSSGIVSSNAEKQYAYVPEVAIPEVSKLVFDGQPVAGVEYYGPTYRGKTDKNGLFEYNWGDDVTFGIQALTLGSIKAKGLDIQLGALAADPSKSKNVENLIKQFDKSHSAPWTIEEDVHNRFALESNNIVELINMNLVNADTSSFDPSFGTPPKIEDEFIAQFNDGGSAFDIVSSLELTPINADSYTFSPYVSMRSMSRAETASQALLTMMGQNDADVKNDVTHFHVFGNQNDGYRLPSPHAATFINIDNNAAPVVMPRSDLNAYIPFGQLAVTDKFSRPFFDLTDNSLTTPTYIDAKNKTHWNLKGQSVAADSVESSYKMNKETATFELPFVVSGKIGEGKVLVLGNSLYNSILVCPENYSYNSISNDGVCANGNGTTDSLDMFNFFVNALGWLDTDNRGINIATNRVDGYFSQIHGFNSYSFELNSKFTDLGMTMESGISPQSLNVDTNPIYILQAYPVRDRNPDRPDYEAPLIDDNDVNALIDYVNQGGSVLIMESLYNRDLPMLGRFLDTAGISSIGRNNVVKFAGKLPSNFIAEVGKGSTSLRPVYTEEVYVLEGLAFEATSVDANNIPEKGYKYNEDTNTYSWGDKSINNKAILRALYRPQQVRDENRHNATKECQQQPDLVDDAVQACIDTKLNKLAQDGLDKWTSDVQTIYGVPMCTNSDYQYQLDCIERREGNGIPISKTTYPGANDMVQAYARLPMSKEVSNAMIEAANMGTNLTELYQHELYYRSGGINGVRLSGIDVDRIYNNLSAWMWNNEQYRYDSSTKDEFGHKTVVEFLNCYSHDTYGNPSSDNVIVCPEALKAEMLAKGFLVTVDGVNKLNPSYPLNYMEKPLTRMMLGRSYFDVDAKNGAAEDRGVQVDVRNYPGVATVTTPAKTITVHKGSRQSAGVWIPAREVAYISGLSVSDSVMVAMADNLTGRINHEMALNRPPRVSMSFNDVEAEAGFKVPYGGSVYITVNSAESVEVNFSGSAIAAPMFTMTSATEGSWITSPSESDAPITEIVGNRFSYTTTTAGIKGHSEADVLEMTKQFDLFTIGVNEFYGRDEVSGIHSMFTDAASGLEYQNMRLVDDIQISIGSAHSGYPVMSTSFPRQKSSLFKATDNWMLGHEIGHNQATNWLNVAGAGETANNVLALYTQDRNTGDMPRIKVSIKNATEWANGEHPWADGTNADRLNFFGQLKVWAEDSFDIALWESEAKLAEERSIYNKNESGQYDQGWNFYKYLHRAARMPAFFVDGPKKGQTNYCSSEFAQSKSLSNQDMMMICSSFLTGKDIETFFTTWKFGESKVTLQSGDKYSVGISGSALAVMKDMRNQGVIVTAKTSPLTINATKSKEVMLPQVPYFH